MLGGIGMTELIIILVIVMIIFGAGKLPQVGRSLGDGIRELKSSLSDDRTDNRAKGDIEEKSTAGA